MKKPSKKSRPLTPLERRFINEYLIDFNGSRAAIRAGYGVAGARVRASVLIRRPDVQAEIELELAEHQRRCKIDRKRIVDEAAKIAFANATALIGKGGWLMEINDVSAADRAAIQSIERNEWGPKYRFHNKVQALELIARMLGMVDQPPKAEERPRAIVQLPGLRLETT